VAFFGFDVTAAFAVPAFAVAAFAVTPLDVLILAGAAFRFAGAGTLFADDFLAADFLAADFLAADFFVGPDPAFFVAATLAGAFLAAAFLAGRTTLETAGLLAGLPGSVLPLGCVTSPVSDGSATRVRVPGSSKRSCARPRWVRYAAEAVNRSPQSGHAVPSTGSSVGA
jgi:hypothetical protein